MYTLIDTTTRDLRVITVALTAVATAATRRYFHDPLTRVVARAAADLGRLRDLVPAPPDQGCWWTGPSWGTVLVPLKGYRAQSSEGFTALEWSGRTVQLEATLGLQLFGRKTPESLRLLREPLICGVLTNAQIQRVATHGNSSVDCARAAIDGLSLRFALNRRPLILEGQSDRCSAWELRGDTPEHMVFHEEHQKWIEEELQRREGDRAAEEVPSGVRPWDEL